MLKGKKILLGVTASISAYKIHNLVRLLVKSGAEVKIICTPSALEFVTPLSLATLSKNPVLSSFTKKESKKSKSEKNIKALGEWNNHVELGFWADLFIVAPASANTLSKMANGICDNLLLATYLSAKCPVWFAPSMDLDMFKHASTKENIKKLQSFGNVLIPPGTGELASGLSGEGRLEEPEAIFKKIEEFFTAFQPLKGIKALVTAGPTYEYIDPVRYIGNPSSGKMGIAISEELASNGAEVTLICGPSKELSSQKVKRIDVVSAQEMFNACKKLATKVDLSVMAAAVADYTPIQVFNHKVKKADGELNIVFKRTPDILKYLGENKKSSQILVGFAMETNDELKNAQQKLVNKNADLIILNSLNEKGAGFAHDTNKVSIVSKNNKVKQLELKSKTELAKDIVKEILFLKNNFTVANSTKSARKK